MSLIEIGHDNVIRTRKLKQLLAFIILRPCIESSIRSVFIPYLTSIFKPGITPHLPPIIIVLPFRLGNRRHLLLDRIKNLAGGNESDAQLIAERKVCFIEETAVKPSHNRDASIEIITNQPDSISDLLLNVVSIITMTLPASK